MEGRAIYINNEYEGGRYSCWLLVVWLSERKRGEDWRLLSLCEPLNRTFRYIQKCQK